MSHLLFSNWAFQLSLTVGNQIIAQDVEKMRQPQLSIDERMATLFRIVDTDVESSGKHIDKCRQIDPCAVYAAYGSGEMQSRYQFHDIVRRETVVIWILRPIPERRWMDNKPGKDQSDFEIRQQKRRFEQRRLRRFLLDNPLLQPHQAGLEAGKFVQQVDKLFIRSMKGCTLRIRQSTVKQCVKHDDKLIFVQVLPRAGLNSRNDSIYRIVTVFI